MAVVARRFGTQPAVHDPAQRVSHYRSIEVVDDAALVRQIEAAISADRHHAYNQVENYNNGKKSEILQISRDNAMVSIGFDKQSDTKCTVYIHSTKRSAIE